jgi:SAM-dependent methyltransferase
MDDGPESYDRDGAVRFPLLPSEHERAWRYIFDWAIAGDALNCAPGDLVLEFGAGPSFASELFNRLGYRTVALDLDPQVLSFARGRWTADQRLDGGRAHFVAADGLHLPFADGSFDGIICLNALHHMPDYEATLAEMRRILKPGARAAFSEPGSLHADTHESRLARERGALERSVFLDEIERLAHRVGFARMVLKPYVYPYLVELDYREFRRYRLHIGRVPFTQPHQVARFFVEHHPLFALQVPGTRLPTSAGARGFGALAAEIAVDPLPSTIGTRAMPVCARVRNTGHTLWLSAPRGFGGHVVLGAKLCRPDGRLVSDALTRMPLPRDVAPGETVELRGEMHLPSGLASGPYLLKLDLVAEQVAWFEQLGSPVVTHSLTLLQPTSARPRLLAQLAVDGLPASAPAGARIALSATVQNTGDTIWLGAARADGHHVTFGVKLIAPDGSVLSDALGRTPLAHDVAPGDVVKVQSAIELPADLVPGGYRLRFDMVHEQVAWFEEYGSPVVESALAVQAAASIG